MFWLFFSQGLQPAVIFCGDLNSYPESGLHLFIMQKQISDRNADWYIGMASQSSFNAVFIACFFYPLLFNFGLS